MTQIASKKRGRRRLPLPITVGFATLALAAVILSLLSLYETGQHHENHDLALLSIPAIKKPLDEGVKGSRNDVYSQIKSGVHVDWLTKTGDWDAVDLHGQQHLHGFYALTPEGQPAWKAQHYVHYKSEKDKRKHHAHFSFNKWRSDQLPLSMPRMDTRSPECYELSKTGYYQRLKLPNTSVVFVAFNEPLSTLFRSIHSVLDRTPPELLHEIILVDDGSDVEHFGKELEDYIALLPKTKLVRAKERLGLMAARVYGARAATGDTLTFLDSHIEAVQGWLPPLLERIAVDRKIVTMPVIDSIDADTFEYNLGGISILGFSWTLGQSGVARKPPKKKTDPMPSPVMAGGLFTIDRKWFFELGGYDEEFKYWGGEEMEISWKIWQCGGRLECIPCSGVGHIFRSSTHWQGAVYKVPPGWVNRNRLRAASVWMDPKHIELVKSSTPRLPGNMTVGDLSKMLEIKEKLQCKSFSWYLENVYPELFFPDPKSFVWKGEVKHESSGKCLDTLRHVRQGEALGMYPCHGQGGTQLFVGSKTFEIRVPEAGWEYCVDGNGGRVHQPVILYKCHGDGGAQKWDYRKHTKQLSILSLCLSYRNGLNSTLEPCEKDNPAQKWDIIDSETKQKTSF
mmetsp:Transcript_26113/g.71966  ORF Transcript_26113/g.71966 Transcript_26113/m.71966 type:complete len:623 (-) Transcript_26113:60-1928(-)